MRPGSSLERMALALNLRCIAQQGSGHIWPRLPEKSLSTYPNLVVTFEYFINKGMPLGGALARHSCRLRVKKGRQEQPVDPGDSEAAEWVSRVIKDPMVEVDPITILQRIIAEKNAVLTTSALGDGVLPSAKSPLQDNAAVAAGAALLAAALTAVVHSIRLQAAEAEDRGLRVSGNMPVHTEGKEGSESMHGGASESVVLLSENTGGVVANAEGGRAHSEMGETVQGTFSFSIGIVGESSGAGDGVKDDDLTDPGSSVDDGAGADLRHSNFFQGEMSGARNSLEIVSSSGKLGKKQLLSAYASTPLPPSLLTKAAFGESASVWGLSSSRPAHGILRREAPGAQPLPEYPTVSSLTVDFYHPSQPSPFNADSSSSHGTGGEGPWSSDDTGKLAQLILASLDDRPDSVTEGTMETSFSGDELSAAVHRKIAEDKRGSFRAALKVAVPVIAVGGGAGGVVGGVDGALEMVGLIATVSFIFHELIWAKKRKQLWDDVSQISDHQKLVEFFRSRKIIEDY